jgi:hypothetical protein
LFRFQPAARFSRALSCSVFPSVFFILQSTEPGQFSIFLDPTKLDYGIRTTYKNSYETIYVRGGYKHSCSTQLTLKLLRKTQIPTKTSEATSRLQRPPPSIQLGHHRSGGAPTPARFEKTARDTRHRGRDEDDEVRISTGDFPQSPPTVDRDSPMTRVAGRSSSIHPPTNHLSHSWRSTLDEALLRRNHQSGEARLYLHTLVTGTGVERR